MSPPETLDILVTPRNARKNGVHGVLLPQFGQGQQQLVMITANNASAKTGNF